MGHATNKDLKKKKKKKKKKKSKSIEEYEVNKLKNEDGYSCFYAFVQLPGHSSKTV